MNENTLTGDLTAEAGKVYDYTEITGNLDANRVADFSKALPNLKKIGGYLDLGSLTDAKGLKLPQSIGGGLDLRSLTDAKGLKLPQSIGGYLDLRSLTDAKGLKLPQSIGGYLDLRSLTDAKGLKLPQSIGGYLYLGSLTDAKGLKLPQSIGGYLDLRSLTDAKGLKLPQSIGGYLYLRSLTDAKGLKLPQSIGGGLDLRSLTDAKGLKLPQSIGGYLDLRSLTDAKGLKLPQSIGGYLYLGSLTDAKGLKLPQSIGGYLYLGSLTDAPKIKTNDPEARNAAKDRCRSMLLSSFAAAGFSFADGILARIVSQRGPVSRVIVCGKTEISYVVTNGEAFSHGKTLAEARDGLLYKIGSRDTSQFKAWTLDREVTKGEAIQAYRIITGACEAGVRDWLTKREAPEKITVQGIIDITKGAYGAETFKQFFCKEAVAA
jgi:hypothetical protein